MDTSPSKYFQNFNEMLEFYTKMWAAAGMPLNGLDRAIIRQFINEKNFQAASELMDKHHEKVTEQFKDIGSGIPNATKKIIINGNIWGNANTKQWVSDNTTWDGSTIGGGGIETWQTGSVDRSWKIDENE